MEIKKMMIPIGNAIILNECTLVNEMRQKKKCTNVNGCFS
jgi:hypothetical protein